MPAALGRKIQTSIGFTNVGGDDLNAMLQDDVAALSPLFEHLIVAPPGQISRAPFLFVYAHFNERPSRRPPAFQGPVAIP
jgi:hypothetical protein